MANQSIKDTCQTQNMAQIIRLTQLPVLFNAIIDQKKRIEFKFEQKHFDVKSIEQTINHVRYYFIYFSPKLVTPSVSKGSLSVEKSTYIIFEGIEKHISNHLDDIKKICSLSQNEDTSNFVPAVSQEITQIEKTLSDFNEFFRPLQLNKESINLNEILAEIEGSIKETYKDYSIEFNMILYPIPNILGDKKKITRVLIRLISNAVEALSKTGGAIQIKTQKMLNEIKLTISEDGPLYSQVDISNAFLPFYSTKSGRVGLGLALCKKILEAHQSKISLINREDAGTDAIIVFPMSQNSG